MLSCSLRIALADLEEANIKCRTNLLAPLLLMSDCTIPTEAARPAITVMVAAQWLAMQKRGSRSNLQIHHIEARRVLATTPNRIWLHYARIAID
jgi:hypothetical protein